MDIISKILNAFSKPAVVITKTKDELFAQLYCLTYCLGFILDHNTYWQAVNNVVFDEWNIHIITKQGSLMEMFLERDRAIVKAHNMKNSNADSLVADITKICKRLQISL